MTWLLSPSGWPAWADDESDYEFDLLDRGYDPIDPSQVQEAIDAFHAGSPAPVPQDFLTEQEAADAASGSGPLGSALRAAYVGRGGNTFTGVQSGPFLEIDNGSQQASMHLVLLPGFTGAYGLGIGINEDDAKGLVLDATNPGTMGAQVTLFPGTDADSYGISGQNQGPGKLVSLAQQGDGSVDIGPALHIESQGVAHAGQKLVLWQVDALAGSSAFGADVFMLRADTGTMDFTGPNTRINGGRLTVQTADLSGAASSNVHRVDINGATAPSIDLHSYAGSSGQFFTTGVVGSGQTASLRAADGAPAIGSESWLNVLTWGVVSSERRLGFFGATPVAKPTGVAVTVAGVHAALVSLGLIAA